MSKRFDWRTAPMIGKAGEYSVAAQLIIRGAEIYFPASDRGVDIMTSRGCRIQVKSAHISSSPKMVKQHGEGAYLFPLHQTRRHPISDSRIRIVKRPRPSEYCDVMVFWGIEQNRFWIVPSVLCDSAYLFCLGKRNPSRYVGSEAELREMVSLGYTHDEIAKQIGVSRCRVTVMLNHPETIAESPSAVSLVRNCEGAWDHILAFNSTEPVAPLETPALVQEE